MNGSSEKNVTDGTPAWPYLEIVDGYALPLEGLGSAIGPTERWLDEVLAASKAFVPSLQVPRPRGRPNGSVRDF